MKLWIRSDLHCSLAELVASFDDAPAHDVAVLAGDIAAGLQSQIEAIDSVASRPVILVAGNHEFWNRSLPAELMAAQIAARRSRWVRFLEADAAVIGGVRFLGGTLWTDFAFYGADARSLSMAHAQAGNADFSSIYSELSWSPGTPRRLFTPADARQRHVDMRDWLDQAFAQPFDGPTVVVSHHAPSIGSVAPEWRADPGTPAYASRLEHRIRRWAPALWVHGHVHTSHDYRVGDEEPAIRVVCNPAGFGGENPDYDPDLVVEV
ncbi:metallophosphoesterase [Aureimonas sp. AU40]|uniref:metallophosphoesterase n=1 Tax=Aureimonas sp. AU40 TaxID=1637747 RepID=UPI000782EE56|nr:metallophosphoesterase [Aureimonas sp. AU40]